MTDVASATTIEPADELDALRLKCRNQFDTKRTASLYAAAHAYEFWRAAAAPDAHSDKRDRFEKWLEKSNIQVGIYNNALKLDLAKGKGLLGGQGDDNPFLQTATEAERDKWRKLALLSDIKFGSLLHVPISLKPDSAADVTRLAAVKFVFGIYKRADAPQASRYAKVLGWIDKQPELKSATAEVIVEAIKSAGGFEAVLNSERPNRPSSNEVKTESEEAPKRDGVGDEGSAQDADEPEEFPEETMVIRLRLATGLRRPINGLVSIHGRLNEEVLEVFCVETPTKAQLAAIEERMAAAADLPVVPSPTLGSEDEDENVEQDES